MANNGVAFSGGGIRSAAFCSGVMRRLLQQSVSVDFLSCVSGGGFVGSAYLEWKHRHDNEDDSKWHTKFFESMRENAGYLCNWERPCQGITDVIKLTALVFVASILIPWIIWSSYAMPLAYVIDCLFGYQLRPKTFNADRNYTGQSEGLIVLWDSGLFKIPCIFIMASAIILLMSYSVYLYTKRPIERTSTILCRILSRGLLIIVAFLFAPWFINEHFIKIPLLIQALPPPLCGIAWVVSPRYRPLSANVLTVYVYAYVIYWRVFRGSVACVPYSPSLYGSLLCGSGFVMFLAPLMEELRRIVTYRYIRSRLEGAFFTEKSSTSARCDFIESVRKNLQICRQNRDEYTAAWQRPLTLIDLEGVKPQLISNVTVKNWRRVENTTADNELLTISPTEVETIDRQPGYLEFDDWLEPDDVTLRDAMTLSAAKITHLESRGHGGALSILGLEYWTSVQCGSHFRSDVALYNKVLPLLIQLVLAAPVVSFSAVYFWSGREDWAALGVFTYTLLVSFLVLVTFMSSWSEQQADEVCDRLISWFTLNIPQVRYIRECTSYMNIGPKPPELIFLADGGHVENLGLLPLLKRRLRRILIVNGGLTRRNNDYACVNDLMKALYLARHKLRCSFTGMTGRDVIEDLRSNLLEKSFGNQPRSYRFKVTYFVKDSESSCDRKVGEGEILYLIPRDTSEKRKTLEPMTWQECGIDLDPGLWGPGPDVEENEAQRLTFCCCRCCHRNCLSGLSAWLCGEFPYAADANQYFTPAQFAAYHRHGYSACVLCKAAEFLDRT